MGKRKKDESTMKEKPELNRRKSSQRGGMRKGGGSASWYHESVCLNLTFSVEIAVFVSMDVVEPIVFGECRQFRGRCGGSIGNSPVPEFLEFTISFEVSRGRLVAVAAAMLRAAGLGVMGTVAGVAFSLVDGSKGRSCWESV